MTNRVHKLSYAPLLGSNNNIERESYADFTPFIEKHGSNKNKSVQKGSNTKTPLIKNNELVSKYLFNNSLIILY